MIGDYSSAKFWLEVAAIMANGLVWLYVWRVRRDMATNAKISEIEKTISKHVAENGVQLAHVDERLRAAVGRPDLEPLHRRMNNMDKQLGEIKGKMHTLDLIHELLLHGRKQ